MSQSKQGQGTNGVGIWMFSQQQNIAKKNIFWDIYFYESKAARTGCHKNIVGVIVYE